MIRYLKHSEINTGLWDRCVASACNRRVYACSWYLNALCRNSWDALVWGDYEAVMPLPWNRKYGLKYVYQPPFTQQLGVFASESSYFQDLNQWLRVIPKSFVLCDLKGNEAMLLAQPELQCRKRTNFVLPLDKGYLSILAGYQPRHRTRIRALNSDLQRLSMKPDLAIDFFRKHQGIRDRSLLAGDYERLLALMKLKPDSFIIEQAVYQDRCIGMIAMLKEESRVSLILTAPNTEGKKMNSQTFLIDSLIRQFCSEGKTLLFDFEGSDFVQTGHFYRKFGSVNRPYPQLRYVPVKRLLCMRTWS